MLGDYEDYVHEKYVNEHYEELSAQYKPAYRANKLVERIAPLLELSANDLPKEQCENSFGISPQGYKLAYSVCGFFCTQIVDLYSRKAGDFGPLGNQVYNSANEIIEFTSSVLNNHIAFIDSRYHAIMKELIRTHEAQLHRQGLTDMSFVFRESIREFFGKIDSSYKSACYLATYVYESYSAPEVIYLRKFRDEFLLRTLLGKVAVKLYYTLSQKLLSVFGKSFLFNSFCKHVLDLFFRFSKY
ncbi:MAG: hypothetical protein GX028_04810 [Clostridiaceae bacterium]|jgi:hypothetical protein|nr:hypothetical protein [Clostridiaceae bacterium]